MNDEELRDYLKRFCFGREHLICSRDLVRQKNLRESDLRKKVNKHLNREAYAEDVLKQYGAEITPYGMVNREDFGPLHEPISEQQQEQTQEPQMGM